MSDNMLVAHCSPTLAGIKTGNLFNCRCASRDELYSVAAQWNQTLNPKGVFVRILRVEGGRALVYVYRKNRLERELSSPEIVGLLSECGYSCGDTGAMLDYLSERLNESSCFPHEIGVFLGYPFDDVKGFIENHGKNCKCTGCWKVYGDECAAAKLFTKYRRCTDIYCRKLKEGTTILRLTVAA